jgi:hypothetical protein
VIKDWRPIPGFDGYDVSDDGEVRTRKQRPRILRQRLNVNGYPVVGLMNSGDIRVHTKTVHLLVLLAFVGPRPDGCQCCHSDGDRTNNRRSNLRYGTVAENMMDRDIHGRTARGERHGKSKLSAHEAAEIRSSVVNNSELSRRHGVSRTAIRHIKSGKRWADSGVSQ